MHSTLKADPVSVATHNALLKASVVVQCCLARCCNSEKRGICTVILRMVQALVPQVSTAPNMAEKYKSTPATTTTHSAGNFNPTHNSTNIQNKLHT